MRRIIERVVTVVTTTTWKISWETDTPHTEPTVDSVASDFLTPEILQGALPELSVVETKEDDPPEEENTPDPA